jgi:hypothetical protein
MRAAILHEIIEAADLLDVPPAAREEFKRLVRRVGAAYGARGMAAPDQIAFARRLLAAGISRPTIRDRLVAQHDMSPRQAYRVIEAALNEHLYGRKYAVRIASGCR